MHRWVVSRLSDGQRFLIGDAAHLSSPFGGEGLNSGLHDGYDLAWMLALVLRGYASRSLLDDYAVERTIADRHVLDVSDRIHGAIADIADTVRQGREVPAEAADPVAAALMRNARAMIDVDYAGSPLIVDHWGNGTDNAAPHPGQRYADWTFFGGTSHHVLVFGPVAGPASLARLDRRWGRSRPRRSPDGRRCPDPSRWPHRVPIPVSRRGNARGTRPSPLLLSDSGRIAPSIRLKPYARLAVSTSAGQHFSKNTQC